MTAQPRALPILFSAPMVRAIIREIEQPGTGKTQTRRILRPQPGPCDHKPWPGEHNEPRWKIEGAEMHCSTCGNGVRLARGGDGTAGIPLRFAKGDRLWVREAHRVKSWDDDGSVWLSYNADGKRSKALDPPDHDFLDRLFAKLQKAGVPSTDDGYYGDDIPERLMQRVSIHMPRWASRLTLTVTDVRVERLQSISEADAIAEGCAATIGETWWQGYRDLGHGGPLLHQQEPGDEPPDWMIGPKPAGRSAWRDETAREAYARLWGEINGRDSWEANPWVAAVSFDPERRNIDEVTT